MMKIIESSFVMFVAFLFICTARSSNFEEPILPPSFANRLVPTEIPFIEYCEQYMEEEVDWKATRRALYLNSQRESVTFENLLHRFSGINYGNLEKLNVAELHRQYAELYNLLNPPRPESPVDILGIGIFSGEKTEEKNQSHSSPPSSTVIPDPHSEEEDTEDDDDSQNFGTVTPPAPSTLRHRHSPPHS